MQPNQVLGIVLLKLDEFSLQRFLCGVCLWLGVARALTKKSLGLCRQENCHLAKSRMDCHCASLRELVVKF